MLRKSLIVVGALLFATSAFAQSGAMKNAPGQQEQRRPSPGPGASDYAPGHKMQAAKKAKTWTGPGASDYAPPHQTTGSAPTKKK